MKKKILLMLLVVTMVASIFTGCGGDDVSSTLGGADSSMNIPNSDAFAKQKEYSLNEYLKSGETIWYRISGLGGKDERISNVCVIEADGTMYYCDLHSDWGIIDLDWTIGDVEQMTDDEIISTIKQEYEKYYSKIVERRITGGLNEQDIEFKTYEIASDVLNKMNIGKREFINALYEEYYMYDDEGYYGIIETRYYRNLLEACYQECINASCDTDKAVYEVAKKYAQKYVEWYTALYEPYCKNIKPMQYKLSLISDSTGNNTETEVFMFQESVPLQAVYNAEEDVWESYVCGITEMELEYVYPYEGNEGETNCFNVYDSWYGGYKVGKGYLVTRTLSPKIFKLDEVGTKNITVDIKDRESLFEQGSVIKLSE